ncbi:cell adhesion molecule CEACAM8-like isoform 2-T2 [Mantella aurantiaca]
MDVASGMMSIELIPQYPIIQGSVTLSVNGITGKIESFTWYKGLIKNNSYQILSYFPGNNNPLTPGRLFNNRMTPYPNGSLQISNLNLSDNDNYKVSIQTDKAYDIPVYLKIYEKVRKPTITTSPLQPIENKKVNLTCNSTNAETIVWSRVSSGSTLPPGVTLSPDNRTLTFSKINRSDSGDYRCQASNPVSNEIGDIKIIVAYGPENVKIKVQQTISDSLITIECSADSMPAPTYQWSLNGIDIHVEQNLLNVDRSKAETEGNYTCTANNSITQLSAISSVFVNATIEFETETPKSNMGLIIGIVIAVILLLVLGAALVYLFIIHRRRKKNLKDKSSSIKSKSTLRNGQTNPSEAAQELPELQYVDIVFSKNMPKRQKPPPETLYANRADLARPPETVYSDLRLN